MWNLTYCNRVCNQFEKFRDHQTHVGKIITMRSGINTTTPYKPLFLVNKNNRTQNEINTKIKINYENRNLLGKIKEIEVKPSSCHPVKNKVKDCPAFRKTTFVRDMKLNIIQKDNMVSKSM